jgi:hypothetical protein
MKCRDAKEALDRRTALASAEADALARHLGACPGCAAVARTGRLTRLLLEVLTPDEDPSPHFITRLRARLRDAEPQTLRFRFPLKALVPTLASLTLMLAIGAYLLSPPPPSPVQSFLDSPAGGSEIFSSLGIPRPTHDQILASILEEEKRTP